LVVGYWLLVIGYWLLVIGYWLLVIGYWLLVIGYWLLVIGYLIANYFKAIIALMGQYSGSQKSEVCHIPYPISLMPDSRCPMPEAYLIFLRKAISESVDRASKHSRFLLK
jgi:hypothetical protein